LIFPVIRPAQLKAIYRPALALRGPATKDNEVTARSEQIVMIAISGQTVALRAAPTTGATSAPNPI
jgi:hypothetical protein